MYNMSLSNQTLDSKENNISYASEKDQESLSREKTKKKYTRPRKKDSDNIPIPKFEDYEKLKQCKYQKNFLKDVCKHYKQKVSGNKQELVARLYNHLRLSSIIVKIQRYWRKYLLNLYNNLRGPGKFFRKLCINETDFLSMENVNSIPYNNIYTYKDDTCQIYAFEIASLYNLFKKGNSKTTNPYNRKKFPPHVRDDLKRILRICKIFGDKIDVSIEEIEQISLADKLKFRTISLFHEIDSLGNYTDSKWFNNLDRTMLINFIRELADIWNYRAQLPNRVKQEICPPHGNPFGRMHLTTLSLLSLIQLKGIALNVAELMVKSGINETNRILGANYVLCALTLVSEDAASSLPWLYQSVAPNNV